AERRDGAGALVWGDTRRNEQDFLEHELTPSGAGDGEMPAVDRIERAAEEGDVHGPAWMAASTLAGVKGTDRSRTPIASKTALAVAAGTTAAAGSPAPHGLSVGRSTSSMSTVGISGNVRIGEVAQSRLVTRERSKAPCALRVRLSVF